jgi:hypothetical protein
VLRAAILALATWGLYLCALWPRMLFERADGLYAGWRTVWADWAAHFAYANVFADWPVGDWFASHPLFATQRFAYPFVADALSGLLMRAGMERIGAFLLPSVVASLLLVALLAVFYRRRLGSAWAALLAATLFFANGGVGFLQLVAELVAEPSLDLLRIPPREYTYFPGSGIHWINIVSSELLPQRAMLLGIPVALAVLIGVCRYHQRGFDGVGNVKLCALGASSSLLLVIHAHSYLALAIACAMLFVFDLAHWRRWGVFAAAAAVPSLALLVLFFGQASSPGFVAWQPGWLASRARGQPLPLWLFLWLNWGVFLPIAAVSVARFRYYRDPLVLAGLVLFVACFLFRFQPNEWDNTKLLTWAHLLLCVPVARYLVHLGSKRRALSRVAAAVLLLFATASGLLDLWRMTRTESVAVRMWTREEMELARSFRELSSPDALVLCSDDHHHWVPSLGGRRVLLGYRGWLASYGIDYADVQRDVRTMLRGGSAAEPLLQRYGVDFVVIGPIERRDYGARQSYFAERHALRLEAAGYRVFEVGGITGSDPG